VHITPAARWISMLAIIPSSRPSGKENTDCKSTIWKWFLVAPSARLAHNAAMAENVTPSATAPYLLAVVMERAMLPDRWSSEIWEAKGVVRNIGVAGAAEQVIFRDERTTQFLFPGFELKLRRDEAEGYYLNITSPQPKVFVLWRRDEGDELARPRLLTVSFNEGARWMDGGATVDGVALPVDLLAWIGEFVERNYEPEPKKKGRWASNKDKGVGFRG
jgi:Protein of unknown function (DUF3305)